MRLNIDKSFFLALLFFLGLGLVQVYSSSYMRAMDVYGDGLYFFKRQLVFTVLGFLVFLFFSLCPYQMLKRFGPVFWTFSVGGLLLTLFSPLGVKVGGAYRWVQIFEGLRWEPGEFLKLSVPLLIGTFMAYKMEILGKLKWWLCALMVLAPLCLLLKQPDFGTLVICLLVVLGLLFAYGLSFKYILGLGLVSLPFFYFQVVNVPYRFARVKAFIDPWSDPSKSGFQVIQSLLSFQSGGVWGAGLGQGQGKLFFLPEAHTDFTLAVFGEEMGFVGILGLMLLYGYLIFRGFQISYKSRNAVGQCVGLGVTLVFGFSVFINIGVVLGLLPTKGLSLPFLSYGGSSLITTCMGLGLLLNIDRENRQRKSRVFKLSI